MAIRIFGLDVSFGFDWHELSRNAPPAERRIMEDRFFIEEVLRTQYIKDKEKLSTSPYQMHTG
jgi:hypothetical protein